MRMRQAIIDVLAGSIAEEIGIAAGDVLLKVNGEPIEDCIDYETLTADETMTLLVERGGEETEYVIERDMDEPLGLVFAHDLMDTPRGCANRCVFCFVDQLPGGMRDSLYFKDDDWRMSLLTGNYVTFTNVGEAELSRIVKRRASPLYISVHATDPRVRAAMLQHPRAGKMMDQLRFLARGGVSFHAQIVLVPGWNDGDVLQQTMADLFSLAPAARSLAVVPVGLTRCREGLMPLRGVSPQDAHTVIEAVASWQEKCRREAGTSFVFASDEFYLRAGLPLPEEEAYEEYPQLENGVGLIRQFEKEWEEALACWPQGCRAKRATIACGTSVAPVMRRWVSRVPGAENVTVLPVENSYFGTSVTVTGLLTGTDLMAQCAAAQGRLLIARCMLNDNRFLDDVTVEEAAHALGVPVIPVAVGGGALSRALRE